jgi:Peptidase family M13
MAFSVRCLTVKGLATMRGRSQNGQGQRVRAALAVAADANAALEGVQSRDLNRQVEACTDFDEFANGTWRADNPIPASLPKWSRRLAAQDGNWHRQQSVLEATASKKDWRQGSAEQVAGDYYASCMDESAVEAAGSAPLGSLMAEIDRAADRKDKAPLIRSTRGMEFGSGRVQSGVIRGFFDASERAHGTTRPALAGTTEQSCWFNGLYARGIPSHAVELTSGAGERHEGRF